MVFQRFNLFQNMTVLDNVTLAPTLAKKVSAAAARNKAVTLIDAEREMRLMKEGGIGGFEVQPVYPLALDDAAAGIPRARRALKVRRRYQ